MDFGYQLDKQQQNELKRWSKINPINYWTAFFFFSRLTKGENWLEDSIIDATIARGDNQKL